VLAWEPVWPLASPSEKLFFAARHDVLRQVADLTGQIRDIGSRICQDIRVSDLAGGDGGYWFVGGGFEASSGFDSDVPASTGLPLSVRGR
jgi:hypothetical protein